MALINAFRGLRPAPGRAHEVLAPPYDVLNSEEAKARADGKPWSFLHISKPEIDLPNGTDPYSQPVYDKAAENLNKMVDEGVLIRDDKPCFYIYRLIREGKSQLGLISGASVPDYDTNRIRKHEYTKPVKEDDRVRQIEATNAQTGPVMLAYPSAPEIDALLEAASAGEPTVDETTDDGVQHTMWLVDDDATIDKITAAFDALPALYIADGHHRSASASRVAAARREANTSDNPSFETFLTVTFPHNQMHILDYNRVVKDLGGLTKENFLKGIAIKFMVQKADAQARPIAPGEFGMYMEGEWRPLTINPRFVDIDDPIKRLDATIISDNILAPLLNIKDIRRDERIDFVGGIRGLDELERRVDSGEMAVAFALYPVAFEDLMAVAEAGEVMPPKSTWFEPKLADGMVSLILD